jgi:hypothetical protein
MATRESLGTENRQAGMTEVCSFPRRVAIFDFGSFRCDLTARKKDGTYLEQKDCSRTIISPSVFVTERLSLHYSTIIYRRVLPLCLRCYGIHLIVIVRGCSALPPRSSVTRKVRLTTSGELGIPVIRPVHSSNVSPVGSTPAMDQV